MLGSQRTLLLKHNGPHELDVHTGSLCSPVPWGSVVEVQVEVVRLVGLLCPSRGTSSLGNPELIKGLLAYLFNLCPISRHNPYSSDQETDLPLPWRETLSPKAVCSINIFEKILGNH